MRGFDGHVEGGYVIVAFIRRGGGGSGVFASSNQTFQIEAAHVDVYYTVNVLGVVCILL